ncbi:1307_t:CDS:2 [Diversispora eburnea]|uniref:1307_t:CDS:1 n=1 Tax=Diversispora eburnea TaxID=1213867 RepID=A0A9N8V4M5_9GLOM|nr:1307_t:CDS:2 [Diversispora eburnea]
MGRKQKTANQILITNPIPTDSQRIARVLGGRGKNLHEVQLPEGSYVIILPIESEKRENKIWGEIVHVLFPEHVKHLKSEGIWPVEFEEQKDSSSRGETIDDDSDGLFIYQEDLEYN